MQLKFSKHITIILAFFILLIPFYSYAQTNKKEVKKSIERRAKDYKKIAMSIWNFAEVGYQEEKSSGLLKETLSDEGFSIESGVAEIPTAFVADVDVVLHWHAGDRNTASTSTSMANRSAKFRFHGYSAHAAGAPEKGRSSLDAVEAMNHMVNLMREHIPDGSRIHYVITRGGNAPNVVPDYAEVFYYVRDFNVDILEDLWARVIKTAEGAALGTGTRLEYEIIHGNRPVLANDVAQRIMYDNLVAIGGVKYTREEKAFADQIHETLRNPNLEVSSASAVQPYKFTRGKGSTDVGDVSWMVPTAGLRTATWVPGTSAHTWQAVSAGGMSIGMKGMMNAAKTIAGTAVDLYNNPEAVKNAKKELIERRGQTFNYYSLLGDREPPLDYRK